MSILEDSTAVPSELRSEIPLVNLGAAHDLLRTELDSVWTEVTRTDQYTLGHHCDAFETSWAEYCGTRHAVGVGSGTVAIELILRAAGIGAGDEVIVPASTFVASAAGVIAAGAEPVFVDVNRRHLLADADAVDAALTPRTAAVLAVHLYGSVVDMTTMRRVCDANGLMLIEDASQAHGASFDGRRVGSLGDAAAFSHYPSKNLGAFGDAGSVTTDDGQLDEQIRALRSHGVKDRAGRHDILGTTARLDALQAAILSCKLPHLDSWVEQRRRITERYDQRLPDRAVRIRTADVSGAAPHLCVVRVPHRDRVRQLLADEGVGTGVHYLDPVPRTAAFGARRGFPESEAAADSILSIPLWPGLSERSVDHVCAALERSIITAEG